MGMQNIEVAVGVRHGKYDPFGGDGGLSEDGIADVEIVSQQLRKFLPIELLEDTLMVRGEKRRVRETAEIVEQALGLVAVVLPILNVESNNHHAEYDEMVGEIESLLINKRAVVVVGQMDTADVLPGKLHRSGEGYEYLMYAEALVIDAQGNIHKVEQESD
ncbi:MAG: hypothetical protein ABII80_03315 [bacterium]